MMRNPSALGAALISSSAVVLLLPLVHLCIQLLGISIPSTPFTFTSPSNSSRSITLTLLASMFPSLRENYPQMCYASELSVPQMIVQHLVYIMSTSSQMMAMVPQLIAAGLFGYIAVCTGYVGLMYLRQT